MALKDDRIRALLADLNPVRDEDLTSLSHTAAAEALFREVVSMDEPEVKRSVRPDATPTREEAGHSHRVKRPAGGRKRPFGARRLVPALLALVLVLGAGTAGYWGIHALGARGSKQVLVIGDQTQSGASSSVGTTSSSVGTNGLLANPYPPDMSITTQTTAPPHAGVTAVPPAGPTPRESAWAKDFGNAIAEQYLGDNWVLVDSSESLIPTPEMVIELAPKAGNTALGSDKAANAYVQLTVVYRADSPAGVNASTTSTSTPLKQDRSFVVASVQRTDRLQIMVLARVLDAQKEPFKPPLDQDGAQKLAEFASSIIEPGTPAAQ